MASPASAGPSGLILLTTSIIDSICCTLLNMPQWRDHLPFDLGDSSKAGLLSYNPPGWPSEHYPALTTYQDFLNESQSEHSFSKLYTFAFETPTTSLGNLTTKDSLVLSIILVFIIRQFKSFFIPSLCNLGKNLASSTHGEEWVRYNQEKITKFGEYMFRFIYHTSFSMLGIWYFWDKVWWDSSRGGTTNLWAAHPYQDIQVGMIWYYHVQSAYNLDALVSLAELSFIFTVQSPINSKTREIQSPLKLSWNPLCRGDFREMALHHVITNMLVIGSSYLRFTRIGSMIFLIHDVSDIFVDMSKLANFMKWKVTTIVCFVTMLLVWIVTRLGILPFMIMKSILTESPSLYLPSGELDPLVYHMHLPIFKILISGLISLHAFWFFIIARIGWYLVNKGETHDLSEHKQGEDQGTAYKQKSS